MTVFWRCLLPLGVHSRDNALWCYLCLYLGTILSNSSLFLSLRRLYWWLSGDVPTILDTMCSVVPTPITLSSVNAPELLSATTTLEAIARVWALEWLDFPLRNRRGKARPGTFTWHTSTGTFAGHTYDGVSNKGLSKAWTGLLQITAQLEKL